MTQEEQRGFTLPVAMFALWVVGLIMTGGVFIARQEGRIGVAGEQAGLAFYLAEQGLVDLMANWNSALFGALPDWGDTTVTQDYPGVGRWRRSWRRTSRFGCWLRGTSRSTGRCASSASAILGISGRVTARVTRMTDNLYFVDADGTVTRGGAMLSGAWRRSGRRRRAWKPSRERRTTRGAASRGRSATRRAAGPTSGGTGSRTRRRRATSRIRRAGS